MDFRTYLEKFEDVPNCADCAYWDTFDRERSELRGLCRRFAPQPVLEMPGGRRDLEPRGLWAVTKGSEFCGEFLSKPGTAARLP
jgi:hypothetical protein